MKKDIKIALAVAAAAGAFMFSLGVTAAPASASWITYYSDASMTDVVGESSINCSGSRFSWGARTPYMDVESYSCTKPSDPPPCMDSPYCK